MKDITGNCGIDTNVGSIGINLSNATQYCLISVIACVFERSLCAVRQRKINRRILIISFAKIGKPECGLILKDV